MKKAKIMLTAIAVITVVGAGLAFKVKTTGAIYCTGTTSDVGSCQNIVLNQKMKAATTTGFYYFRATNSQDECNSQLGCTAYGTLGAAE